MNLDSKASERIFILYELLNILATIYSKTNAVSLLKKEFRRDDIYLHYLQLEKSFIIYI
jgi:hypothetical protein